MKIRRDIASVPLRSAEETWRAIIDLVTGDGSVDRRAARRCGEHRWSP